MNNDQRKTIIVINGWHYLEGFYESLLPVKSSVYVVNHNHQNLTKPNFVENLGFQIINMPNLGLEWGAYQQFINYATENNLFQKTKNIIFMHDDNLI